MTLTVVEYFVTEAGMHQTAGSSFLDDLLDIMNLLYHRLVSETCLDNLLTDTRRRKLITELNRVTADAKLIWLLIVCQPCKYMWKLSRTSQVKGILHQKDFSCPMVMIPPTRRISIVITVGRMPGMLMCHILLSRGTRLWRLLQQLLINAR